MSVFPDIAPESVLPDRSNLEKEIERLREALYDIQDMPDNWEQDEELNLLFVVDNHVRIAKTALGEKK
jgi:hypothetical protein